MKDSFIGPEALEKRDILNFRYPIQGDCVDNWFDVERLWQYAFETELKIEPKEHPVIMTEPVGWSREDR